jgi:hypothetical protein
MGMRTSYSTEGGEMQSPRVRPDIMLAMVLKQIERIDTHHD